MKTTGSQMWKWCAGLGLAAALWGQPQQAVADIAESFSNLGANSSSYLARSWTGDSGGTWNANGARTDQTLNGKAICWGPSGTRDLTSPSYAGGMGTLTFKYARAFTGTSARSLEVFVNNTKIGDTITVPSTVNDTNEYSRAINVTGDVVLKIVAGGTAQTKLDDIAWTAYSAGPSAPSVTTVAAGSIAATAATANGNVTDDGGDTVTERGVVYKTSSGVAITDNPTAAVAGGTGTYSVDLSSLSVNQIYYFKAYALNSVGTTLAANELNFTTLANVPAAPTVDNPTATTLDVAVNANGNPASTEFAIQRTSDDQYLQADGSFGASAVWQTAATWDTTTATGLSPETEYSFQVKARNSANVETAFGTAASESTIAAATGIWINPMSAGTPMGSYYLGDTLGEWFVNFEIGQESWNYAQIGLGTSAEGAGYNWGEAGWYEDGDWPNKRVRRNLSGFQFTSQANHYVICQARAAAEDDYTSKSGNGWGNSTLYPPEDLASAYFAVSAINSPSGQDAQPGAGNPASEIDLEWTKNAQDHNVMVVAKLATDSWTEPTQGTSYSVTDAIGAGTVVYVGSSATATASGLSASTTYDFKFYSENNGYYSEGVTAQAATGSCEPDAPTGLNATDIDETSFVANWDGVTGAASYRLDVSTSETFSSEGDTPEAIFTESMGTVASTTAIATHEANNGFDNDDFTMSSAGAANAADIRATSASSGYTGASGVANVWFPSSVGEYGFGIAGIDASGYGALSLSFGYRKESASANATFVVEYSTDGSTWTPVTVSGLPTEGASTGWYLISGVELPPAAASATLSLRWVKSGSVAMRLDDVKLEGTPSTPSFVTGYENLTVAGTSQLVDGLNDNTTYYFRVRAVSADDCVSANSATANAATLESIGGPQTIDFPAITDKVTTDVVELSATASSGLPVSFSVFSGPAEIDVDGVTLTFTGAGEVSIVASQAGDMDWDAAEDVTRTFNVTKALATVTLSDLAQAYDGTERAATVTTDPEGLTVSVTYDGEATVPTDPGSYEVVATVVDDIYQGSDTDTLVVSVAAPASFSATAAGMSAIDLAFAANAAGNDVVIVANGTGTFSDPSGAPPAAGEAFAGGTVVYVGTSSPQTDTDLSSCTPYYYKAWSQIDGFYSAGLTDEAVTSGPDAPTGLGAVADYTSFEASWNAVDGATGYRLDVSTEEDFAIGGGVGYAVDFEGSGETKTAYASATVTLSGKQWDMTEALIGDTVNDWKNGARAARLRGYGTSAMTMLEDVSTGIGTLSFSYRRYGTDAQVDWKVEYSTNGGTDWTQIGSSFTAPASDEVQTFSEAVNVSGNLRIRIKRATETGTSNARLHIDDIVLTPVTLPSFVDGYEDLAVAGTSQEVVGLEEGTTYYFRVRAEGDGGCPSANSETASTLTLEHLAIVISQDTLNVREGGEGRFYVRLNQDPGGWLTVNVSRTSGDDSIVVRHGASRTFNSSTWNTWQVVTLGQDDDENAASEEATFQISSEGLESLFVTATTLDDDIGENLALGASGSTISGFRASRPWLLIDGVHTDSLNYGHTWWTNVPPGTMTLDLKNTATVSRVRLLNFHWTHRVHRYTLESSTDGVNWLMLADASGEDRQGWDDWPVADVAVRYLKFTGLSNSANQSVAIAELEVYGTRQEIDVALPVFSKASVNVREGGRGTFYMRLDREPRSPVVFTVTRILGDESIVITAGATRVFEPSNWDVWQPVVLGQAKDDNDVGEEAVFRISAAGRPDYFMPAIALDEDIGENLALASSGATITGVKASRPWMLIDGIHTASGNYGHTMWTATPPGTMTLDLGGDKVVSRVRILNWDWTYRVHRYTIESSTDGVNWTMLADASEEDRQGWDDWGVDNQTIRYLKFTGLYNSENQSVVIPELEVYAAPPPPPEGQGKSLSLSLESIPVSVLTSDGPDDQTGWLAVDGDPETAWIGQKPGGGYLVVEYAPALTLKALAVEVTEESLADAQILYSQDAEEWQPLPEDLEKNPVSLNFLWVVFPDDGTDAVPEVLEIWPNP